jgi:hypothetical protein
MGRWTNLQTWETLAQLIEHIRIGSTLIDAERPA